jgi:hypothetical protein
MFSMKITKVLASFLLLGGVGLAAAVTTSSVAPAQAAAVSAPAVIRLNQTAWIMDRLGNHVANEGYGTLPAGTSWRVTDVFVDSEYGQLYMRVSKDGWIAYDVDDTANSVLLAQLRETARTVAQKQGNAGLFITTKSADSISQTLLATPVVDRPGSNTVVRQLPAGSRWRVTSYASAPAIVKGDNSDQYFQIATNQWIKSQYVQVPAVNYLQVKGQPVQVYQFSANKLQMVPTRQLKPHTAWRANALYNKAINGPFYFQVGRNEWITNQGVIVNNH